MVLSESPNLINEDIVISGIGGHFPKSSNIEEFQNNLLSNNELLGSRWAEGKKGVTNKIGTIPSEFFDNVYFGIVSQQSTFFSPFIRSILERTFEALIDAGINPNEIRGRNIGVYMGSSVSETDNLISEELSVGANIVGISRAMIPSRISYWLNLSGPSVSYDCNWMAGMEVIRLAYEDIRTGLIEAAIVGTANFIMKPEMQWLYNDMNLISPDGTTRGFDADAQGYGRSDGVAVFYLQKASDAKRVYASILNVATMFDGDREKNLLKINEQHMTNFLKEFYETSPVKPEEVDFVEAYGCGIKEYDETELKSLDKIYCQNRKTPLLIGSVKSNTGHAESSAVMFSIVKTLIAMEQGVIPSNLYYKNPNPNIESLRDKRMEIVNKNRNWTPKYAAVNALGITSSYGHILLKANPKAKANIPMGLPRLVVASTRHEEGIKDILEKAKYKCTDFEYHQMMLDIFKRPILGHLFRGFTIVDSSQPKQDFQFYQGKNRSIWFVYSGMGSQWNGMVSDLMKLPTFAASINKCHEALTPKGVDLLHVISSEDKTIFENILNSFIGIAAIQIALTDVLKSIGIVPDGIIGHSAGELGCAYADGCLTAEQVILASYCRGLASIEVNLIDGMMAAVGVGYENIKDKLPPTIEVGCHNGPDSSTLSGPKEDMEKFVAALQAQGIFARLVNVANIAYHSRYIKPVAKNLLKYFQECFPGKIRRSSKWISTSNLEENWNTELAQYSSPEYHTNNLLSPVYFEEGLKHIPRDAILIEIAPHGLLQAILKRSLKPGCINIPLTRRGCKSGLEFLLEAIGKMYIAGMDMSISQLYPKIEYPVSRGTYSLAPISHWNHSESLSSKNMLPELHSIIDINISLHGEYFFNCIGHQINGGIVVPISIYLRIIHQLTDSIKTGHKQIIFEDVHIRKTLKIPLIGSIPIHASLQVGSGEFEITSKEKIIATGKMIIPQSEDKYAKYVPTTEITGNSMRLNADDVYNEFVHRGHQYSGSFKAIKSVTFTDKGSSAIIEWHNEWTCFLEAIIQQQILHAGEKYQNIQLPNYIRKIYINQNLLPANKTDLTVNYECSTQIAATNGFEVVGILTTALNKKNKDVLIDYWKYVPLMRTTLPDVEVAIGLALHILTFDFRQYSSTSSIDIIIVLSDESLLKSIRSISHLYKNLNIDVTILNETNGIIQPTIRPLLIISNDFVNDELLRLLESPQVLIVARNNKQSSHDFGVASIAEFTINGNEYNILRRANTADVLTVTVKNDVVALKHWKDASLPWVADLKNALKISKKNNKRVYFISSVIPVEGFVHFIRKLKSQPNSETLRFVFNLDNQLPIDMTTIYEQDLVLSIIKYNKNYAYVPFPIEWKDKFVNSSPIDTLICNQTLCYLGLNPDYEILNQVTKQSSKVFDYSGVNSKNQKIMGLAVLDENCCKLLPDSILQWEIPECLSLKESVSLPYVYTAAYYLLFMKAKLKVGETILIHSGQSPVGQSLIYTAIAYGSSVYTTVSSGLERTYLKQIFGKALNDNQILDLNNSKFQPSLLNATKSKGAQVVINCASDDLIQTTLSCTRNFGRFIHIGPLSRETCSSIGMKCFLRDISFHVVNLNEIIKKSEEIKLKLKQLIQNGISQCKMKIIPSKIYDNHDTPPLINNAAPSSDFSKPIVDARADFTMTKFNINKSKGFFCAAQSSYLICGGNAEEWIQVVEWLTFNGARHIAVSTDKKFIETKIKRRLTSLDTNFGCKTILYSNNICSKKAIVELLSQITHLRPIHSMFLLPSGSNAEIDDSKFIQYIDEVLRIVSSKTILVNVNISVFGLCQARVNAGFPTCNIHCEGDVDLSDIIYNLTSILSDITEDVFIRGSSPNSENQEIIQSRDKKLTQILPSSPEEFIRQVTGSSREPEIIRLVTDNPIEIRELTPLFILPGLNAESNIKELGKNLLLPAFYARYPSIPIRIKQLAEKYIQLIRKIWPDGPYNLVGISWGGVLATEIAKILDRKYHSRIYIYYIDGAPSTIQTIIHHLEEDNDSMEVNLINNIFGNVDQTQIESTKGRSEIIKSFLKHYPEQIINRDSIINYFSLLKQRLDDVKMYYTDGNLINATVYLIRPNDCDRYDNCELSHYYQQKPQVYLVPGDHRSIIISRETAEYINESYQIE